MSPKDTEGDGGQEVRTVGDDLQDHERTWSGGLTVGILLDGHSYHNEAPELLSFLYCVREQY